MQGLYSYKSVKIVFKLKYKNKSNLRKEQTKRIKAMMQRFITPLAHYSKGNYVNITKC